MNFTITTGEAMLMSNDTPTAASKLVEVYTVDTTTINELGKDTGELACLTGGSS